MPSPINRRGFLKTASAVAGTLVYGAGTTASAESVPPAAVEATPVISSATYQPHAYPIQAKPFSQVRLTDNFWQPKMQRNAQVTIPFEVQKLTERGRPISGNVLQAAIYSLQTYPDAQLQQQVDAAVQAMLSAPARGNTPRNESFEVAATYFQATGKRDLVDHSIASADSLYHLYATTNPPFSGGERDAINCIALYGVTQDKRYLDLAKHYLDIRGLSNSVDRSRHNQSYKPVLQQTEAVGHAVNGASLMVSLLDVGTLTGLPEYSATAQRLWSDVVNTKLYITGGIGSSGSEGFGPAYVLPNLSAYSETCAALMFTTFNHKLFLATGDSRYIDVMERTMYNNAIDGVGAKGDTFFYVNRLASATDERNTRWQRASLECCPPNLVRFMASMPGYIYAQRGSEIFVNLYVSSEALFKVGAGDLALSVKSEMPWNGASDFTIHTKAPMQATLRLRIPGWLRDQVVPSDLYAYAVKSTHAASITVNGKSVAAVPDDHGYVSLNRTWHTGDVVRVNFPMDVRTVVTAQVHENRPRVAVERGPIVYCAEWPDVAGGKALTARMDTSAPLEVAFDEGFFGGATVLHAQLGNISSPTQAAVPARLIPYHLWANRGAGEMAVWLPNKDFAPGDVGPAEGLIFYVNPNHQKDGWRYLEAAPFDQSAGAKWGSFRIPMEGAKGSIIGTGKQNTLDIKRGCTTPGIAADLCTSFSLNGFQDWYLPSFDELRQMYSALAIAGLGGFTPNVPDNYDYWTSTQVTTDMARHIDFADNGLRSHYDDKDFPRRVRAIRSF